MSNFEHSNLCVGIDLGTTNSAIATCRQKENGQLISTVTQIDRITDSTGSRDLKIKHPTLPSCVYYSKSSDGTYTPIVGDFAKDCYKIRPDLVAKSIKSQMGQSTITYNDWDSNIPDKKPEDVAARILEHLLRDFKVKHRVDKMEDVVITVPANFGVDKRQATLLAAERAGVNVRDDKGGFRNDILITEPEAVLYNAINEMQNNNVDLGIDFQTKKLVLIYDIGGGTLDLTAHEVVNVPGTDIISVKCLATNEYTPLAGDRFDEVLGEYIYKAYIDYFERQAPDVAQRLRGDKNLKAKLLKCAEDLKLSVNEECLYNNMPDDAIFDYEVNINNGFLYDGFITKKQFEDCIAPLMGHNFKYDDYKKLDKITDKNNIIYPVLYVLRQLSRKLGENFKIDAVILNGGMSKLYMIDRRLTEFFGFRTIGVTDPDLSVAKGAAIWHHYLHEQNLSDTVKKLHEEFIENCNVANAKGVGRMIFADNAIMPQSLYFGMKGGVREKIAEAGDELPMEKTIKGRIGAGQKEVYLSVMEKEKAGFRQIASAVVNVNRDYYRDVYVRLKCKISKEMIFTVAASITSDEEGKNVLEKSQTEIVLGDVTNYGKSFKLMPLSGTALDVKNEMQAFVTACVNYANAKKGKNANKEDKYLNDINKAAENIRRAGNPESFAKDIIAAIETPRCEEVLFNLIPVAAAMAKSWSAADKSSLLRAAKSILSRARVKYSLGNMLDFQFLNIVNKAIHLIGSIGSKDDMHAIEYFLKHKKHKVYVLCAYSNVNYCYEYIYDEFMRFKYSDEFAFGMFWAVGNCFKRTRENDYKISEAKIVERMASFIEGGELKPKELWCAETTLGLICDQRPAAHNPVMDSVVSRAVAVLDNIDTYYSSEICKNPAQMKTLSIARKLIEGVSLSEEEEGYLKKHSAELIFSCDE